MKQTICECLDRKTEWSLSANIGSLRISCLSSIISFQGSSKLQRLKKVNTVDMVYLHFSKMFDTVCVSSLSTQSFLDNINKCELYKRMIR